MARPTSYKPQYAKEILEYFGVKPYETKKKKVLSKSGETLEIETDVANDMPTYAGFAVKIGKHRETLLEWVEKHEEFADAYKRAKDFQENFIVVNGNRGLINPAFGIFTAKNVLGWRDKQPGEDAINIHLSLADRVAKARSRVSKK